MEAGPVRQPEGPRGFLGDWRSLLFGALIVVVMLVRPDGVLRRREPKAGARHA